MESNQARLGAVLAREEEPILADWIRHQETLVTARGVSTAAQLRRESKEFLSALSRALQASSTDGILDPLGA